MCSQISDSTKRKYTNPLNYVDSSSLPTNPDPFVLKFCGKYYCYSTDEFGVKVSVSNDLIDWHFLGFAMQEDGRKNYWAPGVDYWDGQFVMYYSSVPIDSQDPHDGFLRVATSKNPEGPFVLRKVLFDKFTIDAEIVANEEGERFLFYSANDITGTTADNTGTSILVDKLLKFDELEGNPQPVLVPTIEEEVFEENRFGDGRDWYTIEGASFTKHHGLTYLLYSANAYVRENYYIAYAVGKDHSEINQMNFEKYPNDFTYYPLMKKNESVEGTGHNSITLAPNNVDQWVVYHGRDSEEILDFEKEQRVMRMDSLFFFGEKLKINGPTHLEQNAPFLPTVQNYFNKNNETWKRYEENGIGFNITTYKSPYYIYELDLSLENKNTGCRGGAVIGWLDELNYSLVLLDSGSNKVLIEQVVNGLSTIIQSSPVNSLKFDRVYHLKITRIFNHFEIIIDKQRIGKFSLDVAGECLGVCQKFSTIDFKYLAVTETVDLWGEEFRYFGNFLEQRR
ncbi:glycoside hydrolase family 43 protein [Enterococcus sp. OL5]|uniref:glycoside hydrolase family 43 protein n=1 Tax=Enterococcus sp. OL5 TaxID=2590214 RepID=UPI00112A763B|nr:glycoside hydrolase family 43 protein [Enterococcus sp. OL5]TPR56881.1 hypothetical protein FJU10_10865 [Enterococcus sp. OL5]